MDFEQLSKANETIKTTDIKGKKYAEVNQRIKAFRMLFPEGTIQTEIISIDEKRCIIKATALSEDGKVLSTGHAYENEGSSFINKTSFIENCETSAVGRCLGMLGIGIDSAVCSFEEAANAQQQQTNLKPITKKDVEALCKMIEKAEASPEAVLDKYGVNTYDELLFWQFNDAMRLLNLRIEKLHSGEQHV